MGETNTHIFSASRGDDRISKLPDSLLHLILSLVPIKYAARTSILSKEWNGIWKSLPYLNFDFACMRCECRKESKEIKKRKYMLKVANRTVSSPFRRQVTKKLCLAIFDHEISLARRQNLSILNSKMEAWMQPVVRSGIRELYLMNYCDLEDYPILPSKVLSVTSLRVLRLSGFDFMHLSSLLREPLRLQDLLLSRIKLDDHIMEKLTECCPLLETLELFRCQGLTKLHVTGLHKLKQFSVEQIRVRGPKLLKIEGTPDLCILCIYHVSPSCKVDVTTFAFLQEVTLFGEFLTENLLHQFVSQCLVLKFLAVGCSNALEKINISSYTIKQLDLVKLNKLVKAEISAPALETFYFIAGEILPTLSLSAPDVLDLALDLSSCALDKLLGYDQLKFLGHFKNKCWRVRLFGPLQKLIIPKEERDGLLSPLYGTGNLLLSPKHGTLRSSVVELVEYMLWLSPGARSLSITSSLDKSEIILKLLYNKNVYGDLSSPYGDDLSSECWLRFLAEVRIVKFEGEEDDLRNMKNFFHHLGEDLKIVENPEIAETSLKFDSYNGMQNKFEDRKLHLTRVRA